MNEDHIEPERFMDAMITSFLGNIEPLEQSIFAMML